MSKPIAVLMTIVGFICGMILGYILAPAKCGIVIGKNNITSPQKKGIVIGSNNRVTEPVIQ